MVLSGPTGTTIDPVLPADPRPASLPRGFGLVLDAEVRRPRPDVLIGGSPSRLIRLRRAGARLVDAWGAGEPVGPGPGAQALARRLLDAGIAQPRPGLAPHPPSSAVTAVVPVRDRELGLARTLSALGDVDQVIVVDDGSLELAPTGRIAAAHGARLIRRPLPGGPAAARNTGWSEAQTELVAFVDADCEPAPGWLSTLLPHFADPAVGAVAPRIVSGPADLSDRTAGSGTNPLAAYERRRSPLDLGRREGPVRPGSPVAYVPTATLVVRSAALADLGGFDEALRYGEDVDLVWRLVRRGWRVRYEPAATATHPVRDGLLPWLHQRHHYGRSAAPLARRHQRAVAPASIRPGPALAWALAAGGHPRSGAALVTASTAAVVGRAGRAGRAGRDGPTAKALAGLAIAGHARAGADIATAIRRAWLPPALAIAVLAARRGRLGPMLALGLALAAPLVEWLVEPVEGLGPGCWLGLRLADDLAYQSGVWAGMIESRSAAALLPDAHWPLPLRHLMARARRDLAGRTGRWRAAAVAVGG